LKTFAWLLKDVARFPFTVVPAEWFPLPRKWLASYQAPITGWDREQEEQPVRRVELRHPFRG
jgi:hypothetical protein